MTQTNFENRYAIGPNEVKGFDTDQLRNAFLAQDLMQADQVSWIYTHYERFMVGGAVPVQQVLTLVAPDALKSDYFLARRELGIINVGGPGVVSADDQVFELGYKDALYLGSGNQNVSFKSVDDQNPARFYLNSAPAHQSYANQKVAFGQGKQLQMGSLKTSNERDINQSLINSVVTTCQLQMGITCLKEGSVWNTMPAHQHDRRNEVYFYFEVPQQQAVCHFMGEPSQTRHLWVHNEQAVISPPWSIHSGCGTQNYSFIWGMAGENLDYSDMDFHAPDQLR